MPEMRLQKARATLPEGYQFGDAVQGVTDWQEDWPAIPSRYERLENGEIVRIPQKFIVSHQHAS